LRLVNESWGAAEPALDAFALFYDSDTLNGWRLHVAGAGNCGDPSTPGCGDREQQQVRSPAQGYNVIAVGGFWDRGTPRWTDDIIDSNSSFVNPPSLHNDREKPDLVAPDTAITTTGWYAGSDFETDSGTSFATPMVSGAAALLIQREPILAGWPEVLRAILMASAVHNIEGHPRLSDRDGAGSIAVLAARFVTAGVYGAGDRRSTGRVIRSLPSRRSRQST
jgi:subtilisin family serine protease